MELAGEIIRIGAAVLLFTALYALFLLFKPYRKCRWCAKDSLLSRLPGRGLCWRCHGHKVTRRFGAYHVHKVKLSLIQAWDEWRDGE